ncbi:MAG: Tetratricopeptide 2 repeat protein [Phycisphaerales bacterium]|nr:Tetratricopeptide 2 repeat protein [Phycisphaerales bacterium]
MSKPKPDAVTTAPLPLSTEPGNALRELTTGSAGTLILLVLVFACYAYSSQSGYIWDDDAYVTGNSTLRSFNGLSRIWTEFGATPQYYPMTFTSFWLEVQTLGMNPKLSHVINAALHAASVLLLWKILRRLAVPGAWVAAAVFAVHPIQVESVAWISERKNTLSLVFGLSSLLMYLRYARVGTEEHTEPAGEGINVALPDDPVRLYRLFLALFVLALLSKTTLGVLPVAIVVILWWKNGRVTGKNWLSLLPAFALAAIGGGITSYIEHSPFYVGATGLEWHVGLPERIMLMGQTAVFYAYKILWPFPIGVHHNPGSDSTVLSWPWFPISFNYYRWTLDAKNALQWLPLAGVIATVAALFALRNKIGRGALAAIAIFLIGLFPASGIVIAFPMRFSWVADHFAYVGSIGLIVGVVAALAILLARVPVAAAAIAGVLLAGMVSVTFWHTQGFKDAKILWERTIQQNPKSWLAILNYGQIADGRSKMDYARLMDIGNEQEAIKQRDQARSAARQYFDLSLRVNPNAYEAYTYLGVLDMQEGKFDSALANYQRALQVAGDMKAEGYRLPNFYIGELMLAQGKKAEALKVFEDLEALEARYAKRAGNLFAQIRTKHGDVLRESIKGPIVPTMPDADRATLFEAMEQYRKAIDVGPEYIPPKTKLAGILIDIDNSREALTQLNEAVRIDRDNPDAKFLTALIAEKEGQFDAAAAQLKNLIEVRPDILPAHLELAKVYLAVGQTAMAVDVLQDTIQHFPNADAPKQMLQQIKGKAATQPAGK